LYTRLGTREGEKEIYNLAKLREKKTRDCDHVKCIKSLDNKILVKDDEIKDRWKEYFNSLLNISQNIGSNSRTNPPFICTQNHTFYRTISLLEVREVLKRSKLKRAVGPDGIPIEAWKCLGEIGVVWLTKLFNKILKTRKMPDEWRKSFIVPIYKNKGDIQDCTNYRGIKLMSHTMKLWERVMETRIRKLTTITENQFGFMPGRSTTEAIFSIRQLIEKYREQRKDLHMVFIDLEKAYDIVPRDLIWKVLDERNIPRGYIDAIRDMYEGSMTTIKTICGVTNEFPVTIGLHQGSSLSPYLFTLVIDELTKNIQDEVPWCMLFADDIVLVDETREGVERKLEMWRHTLESKGLKISRKKTEYMYFNFSEDPCRNDEMILIEGEKLTCKDSFRYLGSIIQVNGDIDEDVNNRIGAGWSKW